MHVCVKVSTITMFSTFIYFNCLCLYHPSSSVETLSQVPYDFTCSAVSNCLCTTLTNEAFGFSLGLCSFHTLAVTPVWRILAVSVSSLYLFFWWNNLSQTKFERALAAGHRSAVISNMMDRESQLSEIRYIFFKSSNTPACEQLTGRWLHLRVSTIREFISRITWTCSSFQEILFLYLS